MTTKPSAFQSWRVFLAGALLLLTSLAGAHDVHDHGAGSLPALAPAATGMTKSVLGIGVAADAQGGLWLARVDEGRLRVSVSRDGGATFSDPVVVNPTPENIYADGENRPKLQVMADGTVYVSYTQALAKPYSGMVRFAVSRDGGRSFSDPVTVNDDGEGSHRFDSLVADDSGTVVIAWLDKRDGAAAARQGGSYTGSAVYYAVSRDGGRSFAPNRKLADHSCECCRVGLAVDRDGTPLALWRHIFGRNTRDFALARLPLAAEQQPQPPVRVTDDNWAVDACPHHGGDLAVDGAGRYHLLWFTLGSTRQGLYYRRSEDGGKTFSTPLAIGDFDAQAGHPALLALGERVLIVWREFAGDAFHLRLMESRDGGQHWSAPRQVAQVSGPADYPRLLALSQGPLLVWNTREQGVRLIAVDAGGTQ
ncbi:MAG: exo-alpha-sialidase [Betaproteobacteria bacterium]|nr:exo-alpha-sialidase [Betaproteobacteria bacterium]